MTGQIGQVGAQMALNRLAGNVVPVVQGTAPSVWLPGQYWINSSDFYTVYDYNGTAWVPSSGSRYLALLTADPTALPAVNITDLSEVTTPGYARSQMNFSPASAAYPSTSSDTGTVSWGPMTADMLVPALFVAMVTVATGTTGLYLFSWQLPAPQQVNTSQYIQVATGEISLSQG